MSQQKLQKSNVCLAKHSPLGSVFSLILGKLISNMIYFAHAKFHKMVLNCQITENTQTHLVTTARCPWTKKMPIYSQNCQEQQLIQCLIHRGLHSITGVQGVVAGVSARRKGLSKKVSVGVQPENWLENNDCLGK